MSLIPLTTISANEEVGTPTEPQPTSTLTDEQRGALERLASKRELLDPEQRATVETLAQLHHIPLPPAKGFTDVPDPRKEQMTGFGQAAKVAGLPIAGQVAGGMMGGAPGAMIGGMSGVIANKALGISNPDPMDMAIGGLTAPGGRVVNMAARRLTPGSAAAEQQIAASLIRQTPKMLEGSASDVAQAYEKVKGVGNRMPAENFSKALDELGTTEQTARKYGAGSPGLAGNIVKGQRTLAAQEGVMPFDDAQILLKRYREKADSLEGKGGEQWGAYKKLRKSLFEDMDAVVTRAEQEVGANVTDRSLASSVKDLRLAMGAARKNFAKEEYSDILDRHGVKYVTEHGATFEVINPTGILNRLEQIGFRDSVGADQYGKIVSTLKTLAKIPHPVAEMSTKLGSEGRAIASAGVAAIAGSALGGAPGGMGAAAAAYGAVKVHDVVASLFMNDRGRQFLVKLFTANKGRIGPNTSRVLQFAASQFQETPEGTP